MADDRTDEQVTRDFKNKVDNDRDDKRAAAMGKAIGDADKK